MPNLTLISHDRQPYGGITTYAYSGELNSAYTACFGGKLGSEVGEKIRNIPHHILGGDGNYQNPHGSDALMQRNHEDKYPLPRGGYGFVGFGNHERKVEGSSTGKVEQVNAILTRYSPDKGTPYFTHYSEPGPDPSCLTPLPHAELFKNEVSKTTFCFLHIDSNILPLNPAYQAKVKALIDEIHARAPDCQVVISLHHAPDSYGARRHDKKDAVKYLGHLHKIGVLDDAKYQQELTKVKTAKWDPQNLSPCTWNHYVAQALDEIYKHNQAINFIATQSGHDHFSGLMLRQSSALNAPKLAILQGNGSQEAVRFFNAAKQQADAAAVEAHAEQVFGVDPYDFYESAEEAAYVHLGYGRWQIDQEGKATYSQYYFRHLNPRAEAPVTREVSVATQTRFLPGGSFIIQDYLTHRECSVDTNTVCQVEQFAKQVEKAIAEDFNYRTLTSLPIKEKTHGYPTLANQLQRDLKQPEDYFSKHILQAYHEQKITLETLLVLNRVRAESISSPEFITKQDFSAMLNDKSRDITIDHFNKLLALGGDKIYKSDIELVLTLRDERGSFLRRGAHARDSVGFFAASGRQKERDLTSTEKLIEDLRDKFSGQRRKSATASPAR